MNLDAGLSPAQAQAIPFLLVNPGPYRKSYANVLYGLGVLGAILEQNGVPVWVRDYTAQDLDQKELFSLIEEKGIKVLGITTMTPQVPWAYDFLRMVRAGFPHLYVINGGPHPTFMAEDALVNGGVDLAVYREAEETLVQLLPLLAEGRPQAKDLRRIKGLVFLEDGDVVRTGTPGRISDLDAVPYPARHLFPFPQNYPPQISLCQGACAHFFTSRGCPQRCHFCAQPYRDGIFYRSPENVVEEIAQVKAKYDITHFYINDDNFTHNNQRATEICELMIKRGINLPWVASFSRIEPVSMDMFKAMRRSGCISICFGIESGDPDVRRDIAKKGSLDEAALAVRLAQKAGLVVGANFMFGFPNETLEQARRTIAFARKVCADYTTFFINTPYPGSAHYAYFKKHGLFQTEDWSRFWIQSQPVIRTHHLSTEQLVALKREAFVKFYSNPRWWLRQMVNLGRLRNPELGFRVVKNLVKEFLGRGLAPEQGRQPASEC